MRRASFLGTFKQPYHQQGTSQLGPIMYSKGFKNITNVDISPVVIELQKKKYASVPIDFLRRDASNFYDFPNGYFDIIIDKGLIDCLLCGKSGVTKARAVLKEANRVLKAGGMYVMISHGIPESRTCYIDNNQWTWKHIEIEKPVCKSFEDTGVSPFHFAYLMVKHNV